MHHEGRTKQRGPTPTQLDTRLRLQELPVGEGLGPAADKTTGRKRTATKQATRRTQSVAPPRKRGRPAKQVAVPEGGLESDSGDWVDNTSHDNRDWLESLHNLHPVSTASVMQPATNSAPAVQPTAAQIAAQVMQQLQEQGMTRPAPQAVPSRTDTVPQPTAAQIAAQLAQVRQQLQEQGMTRPAPQAVPSRTDTVPQPTTAQITAEVIQQLQQQGVIQQPQQPSSQQADRAHTLKQGTAGGNNGTNIART
jgi:hypothetical protein